VGARLSPGRARTKDERDEDESAASTSAPARDLRALSTVEEIARRTFTAADRQRVHDDAVASVTHNAQAHFAEYQRHPQSFGGRYVSTDLFKETFPAFRADAEASNRYNAPVHNAAAVLASEQLRRLLAKPVEPGVDRVVPLTGMPGAGKTHTVILGGDLPAKVAAVYEGQLASPTTALQKVDQVLAAGRRPRIVVVHPRPETALLRTLDRFAAGEGRGASVKIMADIAGGLPNSLQAVHDTFGSRVELQVYDLRDRLQATRLVGWNQLHVLRSEGDRDAIEQRLRTELDRQWRAGAVSVEGFRQAHGAAPLGPYLGLARSREFGPRANGDGPTVSVGDRATDRAAAFAHARPGEAVRLHPSLEGAYEALDTVVAVARQRNMPLTMVHEVATVAQSRIHDDLSRGIVHDVKRWGQSVDDRLR
jgi:hypothetical protein